MPAVRIRRTTWRRGVLAGVAASLLTEL